MHFECARGGEKYYCKVDDVTGDQLRCSSLVPASTRVTPCMIAARRGPDASLFVLAVHPRDPVCWRAAATALFSMRRKPPGWAGATTQGPRSSVTYASGVPGTAHEQQAPSELLDLDTLLDVASTTMATTGRLTERARKATVNAAKAVMRCGAKKPPTAEEIEADQQAATEQKRIHDRYVSATILRKLLEHDPAVGGVPIRLLRASWMLEHFQSSNEARLESRQQLERDRPEAFVADAMLERVLNEVASGEFLGAYYKKVAPLNFKLPSTSVMKPPKTLSDTGRTALTDSTRMLSSGNTIMMMDTAAQEEEAPATVFPSIAALSHLWETEYSPDPTQRNLREQWLPALEWYMSERVRRLTHDKYGDVQRAVDADGKALSDAAVRDAADFGVFIDFASIPQMEKKKKRKPVDQVLFGHALGNLDAVFAHKGVATLLSTSVPKGIGVTGIRPPGICIDLKEFSVEVACTVFPVAGVPLRIGGKDGEATYASRTVAELAQQGSYVDDEQRGMLGMLADGRRAPPVPQPFDGAAMDAEAAELYRRIYWK